MHWLAQAPSNIALIKYMGKKTGTANLPDNASLSYTLPDLLSSVRLTLSDKGDLWQPLLEENKPVFNLTVDGQQRFLNHLSRIKKYYGYEGGFLVESSTHFPSATGLASSASSFAALTRCAVTALSDITDRPLLSIQEQARISRLGSGSSCRSFYAPWALWMEEEVLPVHLPYPELIHQVVIVSTCEKEVSSSMAHQRVKHSPQYANRPMRAEERLHRLLDALKRQDWSLSYQLCWDEFHDMHELFASAKEPFSYMSSHTFEVLSILNGFWQKTGDGPLVTMDAGPNIHLLYRLDQYDLAKKMRSEYLGNYHVL